MPLDATALIVTVGGSTSNSYATLPEAQAYHELNFGADAWFDFTQGDQVRAMIKATRRLEMENWIGSRVTTTQRLAWPRAGAQKPDPVGGGFDGFWSFGVPYLITEIPQQVKDCQCELALAYLAGFSEGSDGGAIEEWQADDVRIKYRQTRPDGVLPSEVMRLIGALIQGPVLVRS